LKTTPPRRPDRRRERTQKQLGDALLALLLERNYDEIRIEDICHRADLGRATFYLHYNSKDELLFAVLKRLILEDHNRHLEQADRNERSKSLARGVFEHVAAYRALYRSLAKSIQSGSIDRQMQSFLKDITLAELQRLLSQTETSISDDLLDFAVVYLASALHGVMMWAANAEGELDTDALTDRYHAFTQAGFLSLMDQGTSK
jgi:AcrR family transcriptional regulator